MPQLKEKCSSPCLSLPCSRNTFSTTPGACKGEPQDCRESAEGLPGRDCRRTAGGLQGDCKGTARGTSVPIPASLCPNAGTPFRKLEGPARGSCKGRHYYRGLQRYSRGAAGGPTTCLHLGSTTCNMFGVRRWTAVGVFNIQNCLKT